VPTWTVGRYLIAAFTAIVFAGEYGWNTWKLVVPHRARTALIAAKFALVLGLLLLALLLGAVVSVAMSGLDDAVMGLPLPIGLTPGLILKAHGTAALVAFPWLLLTVAYAGLAAILTRSTLGAAIVALVAITAEQMFGNFAPVLALYAPRLVWALYQMLPAYHLANLTGWIEQGQALRASFPLLGVVALGWTISLATLAGWIVALGGLTFAAFRRQDIN
jgi:ABC-2 type transport system permease protein